MTEDDTTSGSMADVDHTHPRTDEPFGEPYRLGTAVPATVDTDGVERDARAIRTDGGEESPVDESDRTSVDEPDHDTVTSPEDASEETPDATMREVDHAGSTDDVSGVFERGPVREADR